MSCSGTWVCEVNLVFVCIVAPLITMLAIFQSVVECFLEKPDFVNQTIHRATFTFSLVYGVGWVLYVRESTLLMAFVSGLMIDLVTVQLLSILHYVCYRVSKAVFLAENQYYSYLWPLAYAMMIAFTLSLPFLTNILSYILDRYWPKGMFAIGVTITLFLGVFTLRVAWSKLSIIIKDISKSSELTRFRPLLRAVTGLFVLVGALSIAACYDTFKQSDFTYLDPSQDPIYTYGLNFFYCILQSFGFGIALWYSWTPIKLVGGLAGFHDNFHVVAGVGGGDGGPRGAARKSINQPFLPESAPLSGGATTANLIYSRTLDSISSE